jgi:hypothetical protein
MQEVQAMPGSNTSYQKIPSRTSGDEVRRNHTAALGVVLGALVLLIPLVLVSLSVVLFEVNHWNLPGVAVYDRSVAWLNPEETVALVDKNWNESRQVYLEAPGDADAGYWLAPAELGYWVDPDATAQNAAAVGRSAEPFKDVQAAINGQEQVILPVLYFDEAIARQTLQSIAQAVDIPPINASVVYRDGSWQALPGVPGQRVDVDTTLDGLFKNAFTNLVSESALLVIEPIQPEIEDLTSILDEIAGVVSQELTLQAYDPILDESLTWSIPEEIKRDWVTVDPTSLEVGFSIPQKSLESLIQNWETDLGEGRKLTGLPELSALQQTWLDQGTLHAEVHHEPTTYSVGVGQSLWAISLELGMPMWFIMDANPGLTANNITAGMNLTIPSKNVLLPLPVVQNKRIVIDISEQRMTVYENGQVRNTHIVSTGVSDSPTMAGIFQIQTHEINAYASNWDLYMPHFMGIYEAWPGFMNGIHGLPLLSGGGRLWASSLGAPASYGCIILDLGAAEDLYHWADPGVVVEITR